jgi:hypothetical protein
MSRYSAGCCRTDTSRDSIGCCVGQTRPKTAQTDLEPLHLVTAAAAENNHVLCPGAAQAAAGQTRPGTGQDAVGQTVPGQITEIRQKKDEF